MKLANCMKALVLLPMAFGLADCDKIQAVIKPKPDKPSPYAFDVMVKMSPKSEIVWNKTPGISVEAFYYGEAAPAYAAEADADGRIDLGDERWDYHPIAHRLHLKGVPIDPAQLAKTKDGQVRVFVTVEMGSRDPEYVLSCMNYTGTVRQAQQQVQTIGCQYDAERYWQDAAESAAESQSESAEASGAPPVDG